MTDQEARVNMTEAANFTFSETMSSRSDQEQVQLANIRNYGDQIFMAMDDWDRGARFQSRISLQGAIGEIIKIGQMAQLEEDKQQLRELYKLLYKTFTENKRKEDKL